MFWVSLLTLTIAIDNDSILLTLKALNYQIIIITLCIV